MTNCWDQKGFEPRYLIPEPLPTPVLDNHRLILQPCPSLIGPSMYLHLLLFYMHLSFSLLNVFPFLRPFLSPSFNTSLFSLPPSSSPLLLFSLTFLLLFLSRSQTECGVHINFQNDDSILYPVFNSKCVGIIREGHTHRPAVYVSSPTKELNSFLLLCGPWMMCFLNQGLLRSKGFTLPTVGAVDWMFVLPKTLTLKH